MSAALPGAPATYNAYLSDFCRSGDAISFESYNGSTELIAGNSVASYSPTTIDMQCATLNGVQSCTNSTYTFADNIFRGYDNPGTYSEGGQAGGPGMYCGASCNSSTAAIGTINRANNLYSGFRGGCVANVNAYNLIKRDASGNIISSGGSATGEQCLDPDFVTELASFTTEAALDAYSFTPSSTSPATQAGVSVAGLLADYNGTTRPTPPSIGAIEGTGTPVVVVAPAPAPAPAAPVVTTWTRVAGEGATVTLPAGTIYRYGATGGFTATLTAAAAMTFGVSNSTFGGDPDPNVVKELDVSGTGAGVVVNGVAFAVAAPVTTCTLAGYSTTAVPGYKLALCQ